MQVGLQLSLIHVFFSYFSIYCLEYKMQNVHQNFIISRAQDDFLKLIVSFGQQSKTRRVQDLRNPETTKPHNSEAKTRKCFVCMQENTKVVYIHVCLLVVFFFPAFVGAFVCTVLPPTVDQWKPTARCQSQKLCRVPLTYTTNPWWRLTNYQLTNHNNKSNTVLLLVT